MKGMQRTIVLISGASGLIGGAVAELLGQSGAELRRLVRRPPQAAGEHQWDPYDGYIDEVALKGIDAVIHLSGAGIGDKRWTPERKEVLYDSRIVTTRVLAEHLGRLDHPPAVFVSQSAIGIYGDRGDEILTESHDIGPDDDFLACLTKNWEEAARPAAEAGIRVVHPRTGLVLSSEGGLIQRLLPIFKGGLGGPLGGGDQWWSWVALEDVARVMAHLIDSDMAGPVNLVAPSPVRQREFAHALAGALNRPSLLPVPELALRVAFGSERADSIGLSSTRVVPSRLQESGFDFVRDGLDAALAQILA